LATPPFWPTTWSKFEFFFVRDATRGSPNGLQSEAGGCGTYRSTEGRCSVEHCHMWLEILNLFASSSSVSVSFCRVRFPYQHVFPFSPFHWAHLSYAYLYFPLLCFIRSVVSFPLLARFESFKWNIVEIIYAWLGHFFWGEAFLCSLGFEFRWKYVVPPRTP